MTDLRCLLDGNDEGSLAFQSALANLISNLSEDYWCAGWLSDCEHTLWDAATRSGDFEWGMGIVPRRSLDTLIGLANESGCWVQWKDGGVQAVSLSEWVGIHLKWTRMVRASLHT